MPVAEFAFPYMPIRIRAVAKGEGFHIFNHNDRDYLISYSVQGEPQLIGRLNGRIDLVGKKYLARYVPEFDLEKEERTGLKCLLAGFWN